MLSNGEISRLNGGRPRRLSARPAAVDRPDAASPDGTPQHVKVYGVTEGFFELFGLPMTLGGFTHENFVPPAAAAGRTRQPRRPRRLRSTAGRRHFVSDLAGPLQRRSGDRRQADPLRGNRDHVSPASRRAISTRRTAATSGSAQQLDKDDINHFFDGFMRLKPGATLRARRRRDGAGHGRRSARTFPPPT